MLIRKVIVASDYLDMRSCVTSHIPHDGRQPLRRTPPPRGEDRRTRYSCRSTARRPVQAALTARGLQDGEAAAVI